MTTKIASKSSSENSPLPKDGSRLYSDARESQSNTEPERQQRIPRGATRHYPLRYGVRDYIFPAVDAIAAARCDEQHLHIQLTDERQLSIPLHWIPPLRDASPQERAKFKISQDRDALIWDPDESTVNEILRLSDYLHAKA